MTYKTHINFGLTCGGILLSTLNPISPLLYLSGCIIGSLMPDIDTSYSYIGRRVPLLAHYLENRFKHRTFTHSIIGYFCFLSLLSFLATIAFWDNLYYGLAIGYLSHIVIDMFNKSGVSLLYPNKQKASIGRIILNSSNEIKIRVLFFIIFIIICVLNYQLFLSEITSILPFIR